MSQVAALLLAVLFSVPTPAEVRRAAQQVLEDSDFQLELPGETGYSDWTPALEPPPPEPTAIENDFEWTGSERTEVERVDTPATRPVVRDGGGGGGRGSGSSGGGSGGPAVGNALLWLLLGVAVTVAGVHIARALGGYTKDAKTDKGAAPVAARPRAELTRPKTAAEALAETGEYSEAIHVLLLETLRELAKHIPGGLRKSLTSREILRKVDVPESARPELEGLVLAVETSLFGHDVPDQADFDACVGRFRRFVAAYQGAA